MQVCLMCKTPYNFLISVGEIVICKECKQKLNEITVKPKVKDGKLLFDKNNKNHRYIVEEEWKELLKYKRKKDYKSGTKNGGYDG